MDLWIYIIPWLCLSVSTFDLDSCRDGLGMENGTGRYVIPAHMLSASSQWDASVSAHQGRIRNDEKGGAWCPLELTRESFEFLQIDLGSLKVITMVETQGRFGGGQGKEYAEQYYLEYQREEGGKWMRYRTRRGQQVVQGNMNTYASEIRTIDPPIIANRVRFMPFSNKPRAVCMRVELYGCEWTDRLVWYAMPQGQRRGTDVDLIDFIYDGDLHEGQLTGGLGQLTDGALGEHNLRLDGNALGVRGYEWVGWRNETQQEDRPVTFTFKFDSVRNFTLLRFHANNNFNKSIRVFRKAEIEFSIGGEYFKHLPGLEYSHYRDEIMPLERNVDIRLGGQHVGRFVRVRLYFDAKWILISELHFQSEPAVGEFEPETGPANNTPGIYVVAKLPDDQHMIGPRQDPRSKETPSKDGVNGGDTDYEEVLDSGETFIRDHQDTGMSEEIVAIIVGVLSVLLLVFLVLLTLICLRHRRHKRQPPRRHPPYTADVILAMANGNKAHHGYDMVASADLDSDRDSPACHTELLAGELQGRRLPDLPAGKTPDSTLSAGASSRSSRDYAIPEMMKSALRMNSYTRTPQRVGDRDHSGTMPRHYASSTLLSIQGVTGNNVYAAPGELLWRDLSELGVLEFPRHNLKPIEKLGEGQFGEVQLCEATGLAELLGDDFLVNRMASNSMLVAVKMLRANADHQARLDFEKEMALLCRLRDPNIVQVLGVCPHAPPAVIVEYMAHGDLCQYLQARRLDTTALGGTLSHVMRHDPALISYGCLIYMATQIASGMKYLESLNMVHRDLAARNCLVGNQYTIKISDFGMSRALYSSDYYRIEGKAVLPIRWMAWESVLLGKFSSKSDVWSFGVTMWELLTLAREQPLHALTDDDVIANCTRFYHGDPPVLLPPPPLCPKEIYDLVLECWNADAHARPSFREIHMFLQRKNMGYNPRDELYTVTSPPAFQTLPASFV